MKEAVGLWKQEYLSQVTETSTSHKKQRQEILKEVPRIVEIMPQETGEKLFFEYPANPKFESITDTTILSDNKIPDEFKSSLYRKIKRKTSFVDSLWRSRMNRMEKSNTYTGHDMRKVAHPEVWLNGTMIDFFQTWFMQHIMPEDGIIRLHSEFYGKLRFNGVYEAMLYHRGVDIFRYRHILITLNYNFGGDRGCHWSLASIFMATENRNTCIVFFDSMDKEGRGGNQYTRFLLKMWLNACYRYNLIGYGSDRHPEDDYNPQVIYSPYDDETINFLSWKNCPQQEDESSCGVYVSVGVLVLVNINIDNFDETKPVLQLEGSAFQHSAGTMRKALTRILAIMVSAYRRVDDKQWVCPSPCIDTSLTIPKVSKQFDQELVWRDEKEKGYGIVYDSGDKGKTQLCVSIHGLR